MKRKIILILFILNSFLLIAYFFHVLQGLFDTNAAAIGIIGGIDGPTVIFITSKINWFPTAVISLEIIFGICLFLTRPKK